MRQIACALSLGLVVAGAPITSAAAAPFFFSTGDPDGRLAALSRPGGLGIETETADDFTLSQSTRLTSATFTGLLPAVARLSDITNVIVEVYRVFPKDSQDPPSGAVPTRLNSPSDVAFDSRDASVGQLTFTPTIISGSFTAANSVVNGINPFPGQTTGGEGPVSGQLVTFSVLFSTPFDLPADHYFFVPQVALSGGGDFLWSSAPKPIVAPGTPFAPDLQAWIRNENLAPDWLRIGTDITNQDPVNMAFTLTGRTGGSVPEPLTWTLLVAGFGFAGATLRRRPRQSV